MDWFSDSFSCCCTTRKDAPAIIYVANLQPRVGVGIAFDSAGWVAHHRTWRPKQRIRATSPQACSCPTRDTLTSPCRVALITVPSPVSTGVCCDCIDVECAACSVRLQGRGGPGAQGQPRTTKLAGGPQSPNQGGGQAGVDRQRRRAVHESRCVREGVRVRIHHVSSRLLFRLEELPSRL